VRKPDKGPKKSRQVGERKQEKKPGAKKTKGERKQEKDEREGVRAKQRKKREIRKQGSAGERVKSGGERTGEIEINEGKDKTMHCPYNRPDFTVYRALAANATLYGP